MYFNYSSILISDLKKKTTKPWAMMTKSGFEGTTLSQPHFILIRLHLRSAPQNRKRKKCFQLEKEQKVCKHSSWSGKHDLSIIRFCAYTVNSLLTPAARCQLFSMANNRHCIVKEVMNWTGSIQNSSSVKSEDLRTAVKASEGCLMEQRILCVY